MEVRKGYKQTEVGIIPEEWDVRPLLDLVRIANGQVDPKTEPYKSMVLIAPDHIESRTGKLIEKRTAEEQHAISGKYFFQFGDIVYSKIRPYLRKAILADFQGLCSADMYPLTPAKDISSYFIFSVLLGNRFSVFAETVSARSGIPKINRDELSEFRLAVPPLAEQQAIAAALSDVDALLNSLDALTAKKHLVKQGTMQELLTGMKRLPGFDRRWDTQKLGSLVEIIRSGIYGDEKSSRGKIPFRVATTAHIELDDTWNKNEMTTRYFMEEDIKKYSPLVGDLLVVKSSGSAERIQSGKIGFIDTDNAGNFVFSNFLMLLRPKGTLPKFLYYYLTSYDVKKLLPNLVEASTYPNIRIDEYLDLDIPFPSEKEQTAITEILSDMDAEITALEQKREKTRLLKQGMMQELLTGKIRLV